MVSAAMNPIPFSETFKTEVAGSFDWIDRFALFVPVDVGENETATVQLDRELIACPEHVSVVITKSEGFVPVRVTPSGLGLIKKSAVPRLTIVNTWGKDVFFVSILPNSFEEGREAISEIFPWSVMKAILYALLVSINP